MYTRVGWVCEMDGWEEDFGWVSNVNKQDQAYQKAKV